MTRVPNPRPASSRAERLQREAANCLTIAVAQKDHAFAADLIDEALRLAKRARELSAPPVQKSAA